MNNINISNSMSNYQPPGGANLQKSDHKLTKLYQDIQKFRNSLEAADVNINDLESQIEVTYRIVLQTQSKILELKSGTFFNKILSIFNTSLPVDPKLFAEDERIETEKLALLRKLLSDKSATKQTFSKITSEFKQEFKETIESFKDNPSLSAEEFEELIQFEHEFNELIQEIKDQKVKDIFEKVYAESLNPVLEQNKSLVLEKIDRLNHQETLSLEDMEFLLNAENKLEVLIQAESNPTVKENLKNTHKNFLPLLEKAKLALLPEQRLEILSGKSFLTRDDIDFIFKQSHEMRGKTENKWLPDLLERAKLWITSRLEHRSGAAAANVNVIGILNTVQIISQDLRLMPKKEDSMNDVRLISRKVLKSSRKQKSTQGAVLKKQSQRSKEQENRLNGGMSIKTLSGVVGDITVSSQEWIGMNIDKKRIIQSQTFSSQDKDPVKKEIALRSDHLFKYGIPSKLSTDDSARFKEWQMYEDVKNSTYQYFDSKSSEMKKVSFKELKDLIQSGKISPERFPVFNTTTVVQNIVNSEHPDSTYVLPVLDTPKKKELFEACQKAAWDYTDNGVTHRLPFYNVYALLMAGEWLKKFTLVDPQLHPKVNDRSLDLLSDFNWAILDLFIKYPPQENEVRPLLDNAERIRIYAACEKVIEEYTEVFDACQQAQWNYTDEDGNTFPLPFESAFAFLQTGESLDQFTLADPERHPKLNNGSLKFLLNFDWAALDNLVKNPTPPKKKYVIPWLDTEEKQRKYAACENAQWEYTNDQGTFKTSFKNIHALYLSGVPITQFKNKDSKVSNVLLQEMLDIGWKAVDTKDVNLALRNVQVKPMIEDMHLMGSLLKAKKQVVIDKIFQNLSIDAQESFFIISELQPLDLHYSNIGFRQLESQNLPNVEDLEFGDPLKVRGWKMLQINYLLGKIKDDMPIKIDGVIYQFKDRPDILEALNMPWKVIFFDTNLSIGEDNELQYIMLGETKAHLVPFRSGILGDPWKNKPMADEVLERLLHSSEGDQRMRDYYRYADAPIRQMLSPVSQQKMDALLMPILEKYQLTPSPGKIFQGTLLGLQNLFVLDLCKMENNKKLWELIQAELPSTLKLKYDLTGNTPESEQQRMTIASLLFPRITVRQQKALIERQDRRKAYLEAYQTLKTALPAQQRELFYQFINLPACPLDTLKKEAFIREMDQADDAGAPNVYQRLLKESIPTYMNVMASMYPLLADQYRLLLIDNHSGSYIGNPFYTIEENIQSIQALLKQDPKSEVYKQGMRLAEILQKKIDNKKDAFPRET